MNIVRLLNVVQEGEGILILVWELVKGLDVLDYLNSRGGVMSEEEARGFFKQLLSGIACIHENGFCHRDIKPENCMIETATGTLKIIDFGLSKHLDSAKTVGIGTPDYMCPEMLTSSNQPQTAGDGGGAKKGMHYNPEAVDVWAMGVMLYLMLTGTYPFEDLNQPGNITATLRRVQQGRMNHLPAHLSQSVRDLLHKMIQVDPKKRTTLGAIAAHSWIITDLDNSKNSRSTTPHEQQQQVVASSSAADLAVPPGLARLNVGGGSKRGVGGGGTLGGKSSTAGGREALGSATTSGTGATIVRRFNSGMHKISKFMSINLGGGAGGGGVAPTATSADHHGRTTAVQQQELQRQQGLQQQQHQ